MVQKHKTCTPVQQRIDVVAKRLARLSFLITAIRHAGAGNTGHVVEQDCLNAG